MIDLDALERLIAEATPGPWCAEPSVYTEASAWVSCDEGSRLLTIDSDPDLDFGDRTAAFIAACDPVTVVALVRAVRALERLANPLGEPKTEEAALYAIEVEQIAKDALALFQPEGAK